MEKWFSEIILETDHTKLLPVKMTHKANLMAAITEGNLSDLWFTSIPTLQDIDDYIEKALQDFKMDKGLAFIVIDKKTNKVIGTTRYTNATPEHKRLEIGYTWYAEAFQKTHVNSECKLLLLTHAFEVLQAIAVEFRTNWYNFHQEMRF